MRSGEPDLRQNPQGGAAPGRLSGGGSAVYPAGAGAVRPGRLCGGRGGSAPGERRVRPSHEKRRTLPLAGRHGGDP